MLPVGSVQKAAPGGMRRNLSATASRPSWTRPSLGPPGPSRIEVRRSPTYSGTQARATFASVCLPRPRSAGGSGRERMAKFRAGAAKEPARQSTSGPGGASSERAGLSLGPNAP
jgi:hypothetical protein